MLGHCIHVFNMLILLNDYHIYMFQCNNSENLEVYHCQRRNLPRTLSIYWTKLFTRIIYTLLQTIMLLLQISYLKKSFVTTSNIENKFQSSTVTV